MPRGERTGPNGEGPKTGRGLGKCNPNSSLKKNQTDWKDSTQKLVLLFCNIHFEGEKRTTGINRNNLVI